MPAIGQNNWKKDCKQFGVVSYEMLEVAKVIERHAGFYGNSAELMLGKAANSSATTTYKNFETLRTIKFTEWSDTQKNLASIANTKIICEAKAGSYSKIINGITVLKIFADLENKNCIYIGLRDDSIPDMPIKLEERVYYIGVGINKRLFRCYKISSEGDINTIESFVNIYLGKKEFADEI